jgi:hypothetical protein
MKISGLPLTSKEKLERWLKLEVVVDYREFDCIDCHCHVYSWMDDPRDRCAVCTWIYMQPDLTKKEIAEIRLITATPILEKNDEN